MGNAIVAAIIGVPSLIALIIASFAYLQSVRTQSVKHLEQKIDSLEAKVVWLTDEVASLRTENLSLMRQLIAKP